MSRPPLPPPFTAPALLTARDHAALAYRKAESFKFARSVNSVPVVLSEIPKLLPHYPIAFTTGPNPVLIALLGARNDENLFVGPNGEWAPGTYIPAYLRRYPFILMEMPDKALALAAEMDPDFLGTEGEPLFADGTATKIARAAYKFCSDFQQAFEETKIFCEAVLNSGILRNKKSQFTLTSGAKINLTGFSAADPEALDELDNRTANSFRKRHWLGPLYLQIASLEHLNEFPQRMAANIARKAA